MDEAIFSRAVGECVSDLRHSGWRLGKPGVGSGPCIWGTCAFSGDKKNKDREPKPPLALFFFSPSEVKRKKKRKKGGEKRMH